MNDTSAAPIHPVTPHLVCADAAAAIAFYEKAFGAEEVRRIEGQNGAIMHALLTINGSSVMLVDEVPAWGALGPKTLGGSPVTIHLTVPDADAAVARAAEAGATVRLPVSEMFWGDRYGLVEDPFGHAWSIATPVRAVSNEEIYEFLANNPMECGA
nr:VOC family protein [Acuticoccus mangrovi]